MLDIIDIFISPIQVAAPFIKLIPAYLIILTIVLVFVPSIIAIFLRLALYRRLIFLEKRVRRLIHRQERGNQPQIIQELETRFREASNNLDQINTIALIDRVYSQEKILIFSCEQIDSFCRTLPNLLIAFGLLGTFLGITINLQALSQAINQTNFSDVNILVQELQTPLKGMGIAFSTSLTGIFFSAIVTTNNLLKNTSIAKYKLISSLEDYLDNIYLPQVQGDNRLDKAVTRLEKVFKEFLGRFGTTVRDAVESSLGAKIQEIVDVNKQANELACRAYSGFQESSGTISTAVTEFKYAVTGFESAVAAAIANTEKYQQIAQLFDNSQFPQKLAQATDKLADSQNKFSQSIFNFSTTTESIEQIVNKAASEMQSSCQKVVDLTKEIVNVNRASSKVLDLHQSNGQLLKEIIPDLHQGVRGFQSAINQLEQLQKQNVILLEQLKPQVEDRSKAAHSDTVYLNKLAHGQDNLTQLLKDLTQQTEQVNSEMKNLSNRLVGVISNQTGISKSHLQAIEENLQQCITHLSDSKLESSRIAEILKEKAEVNLSNKTQRFFIGFTNK